MYFQTSTSYFLFFVTNSLPAYHYQSVPALFQTTEPPYLSHSIPLNLCTVAGLYLRDFTISCIPISANSALSRCFFLLIWHFNTPSRWLSSKLTPCCTVPLLWYGPADLLHFALSFCCFVATFLCRSLVLSIFCSAFFSICRFDAVPLFFLWAVEHLFSK